MDIEHRTMDVVKENTSFWTNPHLNDNPQTPSSGIYTLNPALDFNDTFVHDGLNGSMFTYDLDDILGPHYMDEKEIESAIRKTFLDHKNPVVIVLIILYILSFLWGFIGNILVIHVFTRTRKMRTVTNVFLVNLAICDLMVVCMCMPFTAAQVIYTDWIYGEAWCKMMNFFQGLSVTSSILTLTVISAERFYAIRHPLKARAFMTRDRVIKIIVCIWLVCALTMIPALFVRKQQEVHIAFSINVRSCVEEWLSTSLKHIYNFSLLILLYIGPIIFISVGYFRIGSDLWRTDSTLFASQTAAKAGNAVKNLSARRKVAKMLFVIAVLFAVSWLPFDVLLVTIDFIPKEMLEKNVQLTRYIIYYSLWLGHSNSSVNPICYCIMSQSFKHAFNQEFKRCCRRHRFQRGASCSSQTHSVTLTTAANFPRTKPSSSVFKNTVNGYSLVCIADRKESVSQHNITSKQLPTNQPQRNAPKCMLDYRGQQNGVISNTVNGQTVLQMDTL